MITIKNIANSLIPIRVGLIFFLVTAGLLTACALPERTAGPVLYDFGAAVQSPATAPGVGTPRSPLSTLALNVQSNSSLESTDILYRLNYLEAQQVRSYSLARWSMPPAELLGQTLRQVLGTNYVVISPGSAAQRLLDIRIEEFSQGFDSASQSQALVRILATLQDTQTGKTLAQRTITVRVPAITPDALGGIRALKEASLATALELRLWLSNLA